MNRTHRDTTGSPGTQRARFQAETEPLRLHQVVITAKPYASTPSKSTTAQFSDRLLGESRHVDGFSRFPGRCTNKERCPPVARMTTADDSITWRTASHLKHGPPPSRSADNVPYSYSDQGVARIRRRALTDPGGGPRMRQSSTSKESMHMAWP